MSWNYVIVFFAELEFQAESNAVHCSSRNSSSGKLLHVCNGSSKEKSIDPTVLAISAPFLSLEHKKSRLPKPTSAIIPLIVLTPIETP